jgi:hypothetical protein
MLGRQSRPDPFVDLHECGNGEYAGLQVRHRVVTSELVERTQGAPARTSYFPIEVDDVENLEEPDGCRTTD